MIAAVAVERGCRVVDCSGVGIGRVVGSGSDVGTAALVLLKIN